MNNFPDKKEVLNIKIFMKNDNPIAKITLKDNKIITIKDLSESFYDYFYSFSNNHNFKYDMKFIKIT